MTRILIIIMLCVSIRTSAQVVIEKGNLYWRKIVSYECTPTEMRNKIISSGVFTAPTLGDTTTIVGRVDNIVLQYKTMQPIPRLANKPVPFRDGEHFTATVIYEIKEGRYKVTVKDLMYKSGLTLTMHYAAIDVGEMPLNQIMFDSDGEFVRGEAARRFAQIAFDYSFSNSFIIKEDQPDIADDW